MIKNNSKNPLEVHIWDVKGYVKISEKCRKHLKKLIEKYSVIKISLDMVEPILRLLKLLDLGKKMI